MRLNMTTQFSGLSFRRNLFCKFNQRAELKKDFFRMTFARLVFIFFHLLMVFAQNLFAQQNDSSTAIALKSGAIELGLAGSMTIVDGSSRATAAIRTGLFKSAPRGLFGIETALTYSHANALDLIDWEVLFSWQRRFKKSPIYPYIAVGGGLRQEHLGSFSQARYPMGLNLGIRAFIAPQAAIRTEYKFRRVLHDPVKSFSEHQIVIGISIFFKN